MNCVTVVWDAAFRHLVALFFALLAPAALAHGAFFQPDSAVDLSLDQPRLSVTESMWVLKEAFEANSQPLEVLQKSGWQVATEGNRAAFYRPTTVWLTARLRNEGHQEVTRWLAVSPWRLQDVQFFLIDTDGHLIEASLAGGLQQLNHASEVRSPDSIFAVSLLPGESRQLLIRVRDKTVPTIFVRAWWAVDYLEAQTHRLILEAVELAVIVALIGVLALQLDWRFILLGTWALATIGFEATYQGNLFPYLLPSVAVHYIPIFMGMIVLSWLGFGAASVFFLGLSRYRLWLCVYAALGLLTLLGAASSIFTESTHLARQYTAWLGLTFFATWPLAAIKEARCAGAAPCALRATFFVCWGVILLRLLVFTGFLSNEFAQLAGHSNVIANVACIVGIIVLCTFEKRKRERQLERQLLKQKRAHLHELDKKVRERTESLNEAVEVANDASQAKSDFLRSVSHEVRTPMNAILGFSQILEQDDTLRPDQMECVQAVSKAGEHLLKLIDDILDLNKIESGHLSVDMNPVELNPLLEGCAKLVQPLAQGCGITIKLQAEAGLHIIGDSKRINQIVLNLLSNAIKYNHDGGLVELVARRESSNRIRVDVIDNGRGISLQDQEQLFKPFYRGAGAKWTADGTGIGLAISRRLVRLMGGDIHFTSREGMGSNFWVVFPQARMDTVSAGAPTLQPDARPPNPCGQLSSNTILCIDDNALNLKIVTLLLEKNTNYRVLSTSSGEKGVAVALSDSPSLIFVDLHMPGTSGFDVLAQLRAVPRVAHTPMVALTGSASPEDVARGKAAGFDDYLTKPVRLEALLEKVDRWLTPAHETGKNFSIREAKPKAIEIH